jgi:hypothetical protein
LANKPGTFPIVWQKIQKSPKNTSVCGLLMSFGFPKSRDAGFERCFVLITGTPKPDKVALHEQPFFFIQIIFHLFFLLNIF